MKKYMCCSCKHIFQDNIKPNFCPVCGKTIFIHPDTKARQKALSTIAEIKQDQKILLDLWEAYAKQHAKTESKLQLLRVYKKRGIVEENEIPKVLKPKLSDVLKKYREKIN